MLTELLTLTSDAILAAPASPAPTAPANPVIDTAPVITFLLTIVCPPIAACLGVIFLGRARKGEVSAVFTSAAIALFGFAFIAAAPILFLLGDDLVRLVIK